MHQEPEMGSWDWPAELPTAPKLYSQKSQKQLKCLHANLDWWNSEKMWRCTTCDKWILPKDLTPK